MGARGRSKRRRGASARSADLISGLCDDVLLHILELLPDAGDAVRTGALSRRWRGLWTRASSLTFDSSSSRREFKRASDYKRFLAFVDNALAQRAMADDADLEHLAISFAIRSPVGEQATKRLLLRSTEAAREWIRCATQSTAKSFVLKLWLLRTWNLYQPEQPMMDLSDLPASSENLETMHWGLGGVRLKLPTAAVFPSLVDLLLEDIDLSADSGHLFARLLSSSCCPSLQKLQLMKLTFPKLYELLIDASALLELSMSRSSRISLWNLKLKTPSLRILHLEDNDYLDTLEISAPRLEELTFLINQLNYIVVDGELPCMGRLKIELFSHRDVYDDEYDINIGSICLLCCCTSLTCLEVSLRVTKEKHVYTDDIISGRIPHLPHLISLTVHAYSLDLHSFGVGIAEILKQCSNLKYLLVHCIQMGCRNLSLCKHPDHWKSDQICLANIQKVRFRGLAGTDCESSFVPGVLAHATQFQKVALSFDPRFRRDNRMDCSRFISCGGGTWVYNDPSLSYEWNSDPI